MTLAQYNQEIRRLTDDLNDEKKGARYIKKHGNIHSAIESVTCNHKWIRDTHKAHQVLTHSPNWNAYEENHGHQPHSSSYVYSTFCRAQEAMLADLIDQGLGTN